MTVLPPLMPRAKPSDRKPSRRRRRKRKRGEAPGEDRTDAGDPSEGDEAEAEAEAESEAESEDPPSYTIDELTAQSGVPSRTIRFYQSSGVLPKPEKRGRVAYYGPLHLERLELIGQLQDRGLRMRAIRELVEQIDRDEVDLQEWLGLEEQLQSSWVDDRSQILSREQLEDKLGERRPGFLAELARTELIEQQSDGTFLVQSPGLLQIALGLDDAGIDVAVATGASAILQKHLAKAAVELAEFFAEHAGEGFGQGNSVAAITEAFRELRTLGLESVRLLFAREMEQVLRKMVETGEAARIDKKKRRRKR